MPTYRFLIVFEQGEWGIKYCDRMIGPFSSQQDSISAAIEAARDSGCLGHETEVLVRDEDGSLRAIWTYGEDS